MNKSDIYKWLDNCHQGIDEKLIPSGVIFRRGKVRDVFTRDEDIVLSVTDRVSAFDRVLATIPFKGEVLNKISLFWFENTSDIIENHVVKTLTPRTILAKRCSVVPLEIVVRGYLTGSAYRDYKAGKEISGIPLPDGMHFNQAFDKPLVTPSTKEDNGEHDKPISREEILKGNIVSHELWKTIEETALSLFQRGTEIAEKNGLILVDTKYEFGLCNDRLVLVDELHTPDSSRFWIKDSYQTLFEKEQKQQKLDKEYLRQWLMDQGFSGEGKPPEIPDEVRVETSMKYIQAYEYVTGKKFTPESINSEAETQNILSLLME